MMISIKYCGFPNSLEMMKANTGFPRKHISSQTYTTLSVQGVLSYLIKPGYEWSWRMPVSVRVPKNWCFWTVVLEKTLESTLDCKEINPVHPKGNQSWIFIGRTDAEAEVPILWPTDAKSWLIRNDPDARKDWRQEGKGTADDEMVGWHHWLNGPEFEQAQGDGEGQGSLACCSLRGGKESAMIEQLNKKTKGIR